MLWCPRWAHVRRINDPKQKTPNSYTWAQLVVFYLQRVEPPVLPCLQALRGGEWADAWPCDAASLPSAELLRLLDPDLNGVNSVNGVSRDTDTTPPRQPVEGDTRAAALRGDFQAACAATAAAHAPAAAVSLGQLLCGFFGFWLDYLDLQRTSSVVSVRHGRLMALNEKVWDLDEPDAERPLIGLEDPVEVAQYPPPPLRISPCARFHGLHPRASQCIRVLPRTPRTPPRLPSHPLR
jgi:DNA polymerase sigma